jgi:hypothetical protein
MVLGINNNYFPNIINRLFLVETQTFLYEVGNQSY